MRTLRKFFLKREGSMDNKKTTDEIPMGFAMSLAQNSKAMRNYALMSDDERSIVNERASKASSKKEMRGIVGEIAERHDIG